MEYERKDSQFSESHAAFLALKHGQKSILHREKMYQKLNGCREKHVQKRLVE